jgi:hypothetical protein
MSITTRQRVAKTGQIASALAAVLLLLLHLLSPEFDPSWRMISEYAYGNYEGVLTAMFLVWGLAEWCALIALAPVVTGGWSRLALVLLAVSGLGAVMGGLFDVRHPLHGAAFGLGVPFLPIAALILSVHLTRNRKPVGRSLLVLAHATWVAFAAQVITMMMFIAGLKAAGAFHPETPAMLPSLPAGVPAVVGYPNRLLVLAYLVWVYLANRTAEGLHKSPTTESHIS